MCGSTLLPKVLLVFLCVGFAVHLSLGPVLPKGFVRGAPLPRNPLSGVFVPAAYQCTEEEKVQQLHRLVPFQSACPGNEWWGLLYAAGLSCRDLTLVDIGANKGYVLATWMEMVRPESGVSPRALLQRFQARFGEEGETMEGQCNDYEDPPLAHVASRTCRSGGVAAAAAAAAVVGGGRGGSSGKGGKGGGAAVEEKGEEEEEEEVGAAGFSVSLHAFEPTAGNIQILSEVLKPWVEASANVQLTVHGKAVVGDPHTRQVEFGACLLGSEKCGVRTEGFEGDSSLSMGAMVPAVTVDAFVEEEGLDVLDILAIDAEGMDPEVIKGADALLLRQGVRLLMFEYHMLRAWSSALLEDVVVKLDGYGYDCFFLQRGRAVVRLTGCWHPRLETHNWGNVMCVLRREVGMLAVLQGMMVTVTGQKEAEYAVGLGEE
jgi:FkbM family methyltransferase